jgi:putative (di)nucleoside polyphosphate hydrolase
MSNSQRENEGRVLGYRPGVGIMVLNREGLVWVGRRADAPGEPEGPGAWWQMPQGGIDDNEAPKVAAFRELFEETGMRSAEVIAELPDWLSYDLPPDLAGRAWSGRYRGQKQKWFAMRFLGPDSEIDISAPAGHNLEFEAWRWVAVGELLGLVVPFKRDVYARVVATFGPIARPI